MADFAEKAFREMYCDREMPQIRVKYSRAFRGLNANVRYNKKELEFHLSFTWKDISEEIKIGLIQSLLNKVLKTKLKTMNMELYSLFLKKISNTAPVTTVDPLLKESFDRVNEHYFAGMQLTTNLTWGGENFNVLGTYDYTTDTIKISTALREDMLLLDYVMYHEILHKKLRYTESNSRRRHHTTEFRRLEHQFEDPDIERKLNDFLRKKRFRSAFSFF
jgi:hypothetical protein